MSDVVFVDSNILIYAHDADAGAKRERGVEKLRGLCRRLNFSGRSWAAGRKYGNMVL